MTSIRLQKDSMLHLILGLPPVQERRQSQMTKLVCFIRKLMKHEILEGGSIYSSRRRISSRNNIDRR